MGTTSGLPRVTIVGSGQLGAHLVTRMHEAGWDVAVIDRDPNSFLSLPAYIASSCFAGDPWEPKVMEQAGTGDADVLIAVTSGDHLNVLIGVIARDVFRVRHSIARIRDPARAESLGHLDVEIVCSTALEASVINHHIEKMGRDPRIDVTVVGCGHLGSRLANLLSRAGHRTVVIDHRASSFGNLDAGFGGERVEGDATDPSVLRKANLNKTDLMIAATHDDAVNLMAALVANRFFGPKEIIARVHDPRREVIFEELGFATVSPTGISAGAISRIASRCLGVARHSEP